MNEQDPGAERHINIHLSPEIMGGVYANFANVSHSDYEFTVTFARVDQLAHEAGREVDPRDDDSRNLDIVDLVVDTREGHCELVVGVADVCKVRIHAGHDLG